MADALRAALSRFVRCGRRLTLGRLSEVGAMFDAMSTQWSEHAARLDTLATELAALKARLGATADRLDALQSPRTLSPGGLIDYQIEVARSYMQSAVGDIAPGFRGLYERCKMHTTASVEQLYAVHTAVEYLDRSAVVGDIVDCGAGLGGTAMMAALTGAGREGCERRLVLFDYFDELPAEGGDAVGPLRERLAATGYPADRIEIISGLVERTVPQFAAGAIAFLRIDTDSYTATKAVLRCLCPRLSAGAVLLINDAPSLLGPRQATAEFFDGDGKLPLFNRIDYCTRVAVWPGCLATVGVG